MEEHKNICPHAAKNCGTNRAKLFYVLLMKMPGKTTACLIICSIFSFFILWRTSISGRGGELGVLNKDVLPETSSTRTLVPINGNTGLKRTALDVLSPDISTPNMAVELIDHWNDEFEAVIITSQSLPSSENAFASSLRAFLFQWRLKGKKGLWLKLHTEQDELVLVTFNEGFNYHHAEAAYVMLTFWIPDLSSMLSSDSSHHVGVAAFLILGDACGERDFLDPFNVLGNGCFQALPPCGL